MLKPGKVSSTIRSSEALPLLPREEVNSPDTFICVPNALLVTFTLTVHTSKAPTPKPVILIVLPPSGALSVLVSLRIQVLDALAGLAMVTPAGSVSLKARSSACSASSLVMVKISVLTLPGPMVSGLKALLKPGVSYSIWVPAAVNGMANIAIATANIFAR